MDRVQIIERTLRCYHAGWWSLIPILGLAPAAAAFYLFLQIRAETEGEWNPAATHLRWGIFLASLGSSVSLFLLSLPLWQRLL
jgi:hypothetical protein